jgi:endonuclease/exonuclease/phosphatase family metal-dependent hydrolase
VMKEFLLPAAAILMTACAPTVNLLNPTSPKFEGAYAAQPAPRADSRSTLRIVSFNIKLADRIEAAIEVLQSGPLRDADIISLQEMDESGTERIARALHLNYVYYPGSIHPTRHRYFGPAILTRWPIEKSWKVMLPYEEPIRHQRRTATAAIVNVRGLRVQVYAVHLDTQIKASEHERQEQAAALLADARTAPGPVILAGDFNSWGIGRYFEQQGLAWPTRDVGKTITIFSWDHIFIRGLTLRGSTAGKVSKVHGASDHRPIWTSLPLAAPRAITASSR